MSEPGDPLHSVVEGPEGAHWHLRGCVTVVQAGELHRTALTLARRSGDIVVRCEELERLDSAALQVLFALNKELGRQGRSLVLRGAGEAARQSLQACGLVVIDGVGDCGKTV